MTSSWFGPKIYLRGAKPHILIYGGLGHRPLLSEELELVWDLCMYIAYLYVPMENTSSLGYLFVCIFASVDVKYHVESKSEPKPLLPQKQFYLSVHYFVTRSWE